MPYDTLSFITASKVSLKLKKCDVVKPIFLGTSTFPLDTCMSLDPCNNVVYGVWGYLDPEINFKLP